MPVDEINLIVRLKILKIIIVLVITYLYDCSNGNESITKNEKNVNDSTTLIQTDTNSVLKKTFDKEFFTQLKSQGFEIDSVKSFNEYEIKPLKISQLFT